MLSIDIETDTEIIYVDRIGFRGDVFKDRD